MTTKQKPPITADIIKDKLSPLSETIKHLDLPVKYRQVMKILNGEQTNQRVLNILMEECERVMDREERLVQRYKHNQAELETIGLKKSA